LKGFILFIKNKLKVTKASKEIESLLQAWQDPLA
jgi:hypothetical protein